eukprot:439904-Amphidinium_carterae.1
MALRCSLYLQGLLQWLQQFKPYNFQIKCWCRADYLQWQLHDVISAVLHSDVRLSRFIARDISDYRGWYEGLFGSQPITENHRTASANNRLAEADAQTEFTIKTDGLLLLLLWLRYGRHKASEQQRAEEVFQALVYTFCFACEHVAGGAMLAELAFAPCCSAMDVETDCCECLVECRELMQAELGSEEVRADSVAAALVEMARPSECVQRDRYLAHIITQLSEVAHSTFRVSSWNTDALRSLPPVLSSRAKRQKRVDTDLKRAAFEAVTAGRAHKMKAQMRATGDPRGGGVKKWDKEQLRGYLYAASQVFSIPSSISMCPDAARFGNPGEEVLVSPAVRLASGTSMWMPPQVHMHCLPERNLVGRHCCPGAALNSVCLHSERVKVSSHESDVGPSTCAICDCVALLAARP